MTSSPLATIVGTVYEVVDESPSDGRRAGVAGVSVSDGVSVVQTDANGNYRLQTPVGRRLTSLVFVTQPSGYSVGVDSFCLPTFYRDLGRLQASEVVTADFQLHRDPASRRHDFRFAVIADPEVNGDLGDQLAQVVTNPHSGDAPAFIVAVGDLTCTATDAEFEIYKRATARARVPVWPTVGNHDIAGGGIPSPDDDPYPERIDPYRRNLGPEWYSFDYGDVHFVSLDNNGSEPFDEQIAWLQADLAVKAGFRLVVCMHQPLNTPFWSLSRYDRLRPVLSEWGAELVLVGHGHTNEVDRMVGSNGRVKHVQTTASHYTIDNSPRGFRYVRVRPGGFDTQFRQYGVRRQLTVITPADGSRVTSEGAGVRVVVRAYDTGMVVAGVRCRIDKAAWVELATHPPGTWAGVVPCGVSANGDHTLEVTAHSAEGSVWRRLTRFRTDGDPPPTPYAGTEWTQHHGDSRHSGVAMSSVSPEGLELAWIYSTGGSLLTAAPLVVGSVVYAASRDEDGGPAAAIHAIDLSSGSELWRFHTEGNVQGTPAFGGGVLYAQTMRGVLYAVSVADGKLQWCRRPNAAPEPYAQRSYSYYGVSVDSGRVFWARQVRYRGHETAEVAPLAGVGLLSALDPSTGETDWEAELPSIAMSAGTPAIGHGLVFIGSGMGDQLFAFDVESGAERWRSEAELPTGWQTGVPAVGHTAVLIGASNGLVARSCHSGETLWVYRSPGPSHHISDPTPATPAIAEGCVYMGFPDGRVTCLSEAAGTTLWTRCLPGKRDFGGVFSSPVVSGLTLYVGSNNGRLYALNAGDGSIEWEYELGSWACAGPVVTGNTVLIGCLDGNIYAFASPHAVLTSEPSTTGGVSR